MDISNDVLIDAKNLRSTNIQKRQIREYTIEILRRINDELKISHNEGKQILVTELPIIFNITNMSENNARREVWFNIIDCLKNKNYRISINPKPDSCVLKITWVGKEDEIDFKHKINVINLHTKQF
jgi:hypothetical protein